MATKSELWDQYLQLIKILDEIYKYGAVNTPNFVGMESDLQDLYKGSSVGSTQQQVTNFRASLSALLANGSSMVRPVLLELAKIGYDSINTAINAALDDIYSGMIVAAETVKERGFTFGSVSAGGSNNGDGTVYRIIKDADNHDLEGGFQEAGDTKLEIARDFATGSVSGSEEVTIFGSGEIKTDELSVGDAPSEKKTLSVIGADSSANIITNGDFENSSGSAAGPDTDFPGWNLSSLSDIDVETGTVFRGKTALEFLNNADILQYLSSVSIDTTRPVFVIVRFNRQGSCNGTLTVRLGTQTEAVSLVAQSGWTDLVLGVDISIKGWYEIFKEDYTGEGIRVQLTLSGRTIDTLIIDEFVVAQPVLYDGKYYLVTAGETNYLLGDYFIFSDSVSNTGRTQLWTARLFGKYFPHTSGSPTYADK